MTERLRVKHILTFDERLAAEAKRLKEQAGKLPLGKQRDELVRKARQIDVASHMNEWLSSPGLQPPKQS